MTRTDHADGLQDLVLALAEAIHNDPGDKPVPMATTDAREVIKAQLTENTGTHFLDSGGAYGRHWERNQDDPPWEHPAWDVSRDFVTNNVYHFMDNRFDRDRGAFALEMALYAYGYRGPGKDDSWLATMEGFAEGLIDGKFYAEDLREWGVPNEIVDVVLGLDAYNSGGEGPFTVNTYNGECHSLSQVLQGTNLGGPYAEYAMIQVHQGADVRGGYTGPRVYSTFDGWIPGELFFRCDQCGWEEAESVLYGDESLLYQPTIDPFELEDEGWLEEGDEEHPALAAAYDAEHTDGAVFHRCDGPIGNFGHVSFM